MALLIKNGLVLQGKDLVQKNIFIHEGRITKITTQKPKAETVIDARGNIILPGLIDPHVHFRDPGLTYKEDFVSGSRAAAAGGVTTVFDMPNTLPPTFTVGDLEDKRIVAKKAVVNYGFHFGSDPRDNVNEIGKAQGYAAVKIYLNLTTGNLLVKDYKLVERIFQKARFVMVHAEGDSVAKTITIAQKLKKKFYLCHVSTEKDLALALSYKDHVYLEVSPHHLFLTENDCKRLGNFSFVYPPIRKEKDRNALWRALKAGAIDTIATDHAPHTMYEKEKKKAAGVPGLETMLPLLLNAVNQKKLKLADVVRLCCENPATLFGIKNKGFIKEGYDADLTIVDMNLKKKVRDEELFTKCRWSPFNNKVLKGWPITTIVNGNIVFDKGKINPVRGKEVEYD